MLTSLRYKFILSLLVTSMVSAVLIVGVAYVRLIGKFDDMILQNAIQSFRGDVSAYFHAYGSWEEGQRHEDFPSFSNRRHQKLGLPLIRGLNPVNELVAIKEVEMEPLTSPKKPPLPGDNLRRPPFRFYLFDTQWRALLPLDPYHVGEPIQAGLHKTILPIKSDGNVLAYFSPEGHVYYSDLDLGYLAAMREAMIYGFASATLLTLVLGLTFGNHLSIALRQLTAAPC